jgi:SAM-dependent methyltransferase
MDLRAHATAAHIDAAKRLAVRGLLHYQPFIFSDEFSVGAGLSIASGYKQNPPLVDFPDVDQFANDDFRQRFVVPPDQRPAFIEANARMRELYDGMLDDVAGAIGGFAGKTVLDVGCNSGYFALGAARGGAARVVGVDREDYTDTVALLNGVCGTNVEFRQWTYDGGLVAPEQFDVVLSIAVLPHLSEPLRHLAWLGSAARHVLWVFTGAPETTGLRIEFHSVNRYYAGRWPQVFDVVTLSQPLLRLAFEQMDFAITEVPTRAMPLSWRQSHLNLVGIRNTPV